MATIKQIKAAQALVENGGNVSAAMREVGYSEHTAHTPQKLTESDGFKEVMEKSGLTDDFLTKALYEDIKGKPKRREKELRLAFQVKGRLSNNPDGGDRSTYNFLTIIGGDQAKRIAGRVLSNNATSEESPDRLLHSDKPELHPELAP